MENATKALLISAGILFAIVIISIGVLSYSGIKNYYAQKQTSLTAEQLAAFNREFEAYNRDDVTGFELVSLINKIINFNSNNAVDEALGFANTEKNFEKMYIEFTITDSSLTEKTEGVRLFSQNKYNSEHSNTNTELVRIIKEMQGLENRYSASALSKLVSNRESLVVYGGDGTKDIEQVLGKLAKVPGYNVTGEEKYSKDGTEEIIKYEQYIAFKRANFKCTGTEYNNNTHRIVKLFFEQV